jgi:hypothetical protein
MPRQPMRASVVTHEDGLRSGNPTGRKGFRTQASVKVGTDAGKRADKCHVPDIHVNAINAPLAGAPDDDVERGPLPSRKSVMSKLTQNFVMRRFRVLQDC